MDDEWDWQDDYNQQQEYHDYLASVGTLDGWPPMDPPEDHADTFEPPLPCHKWRGDNPEECEFCGFSIFDHERDI